MAQKLTTRRLRPLDRARAACSVLTGSSFVHWQADELSAPARCRQLLPQARVHSRFTAEHVVAAAVPCICRATHALTCTKFGSG